MAYKNLPDLTFAESDPDLVELQIVEVVEKLLGRKLARADPLRLFLKGIEALLIQQRLLIDATAKQGLLAYATGDNLAHLGILVGTERLPAAAAKTTMQLTLSASRETATVIPAGTRFTAGDGIMFALDSDTIIEAGQLTATGAATCTEKGAAGNGYKAGELSVIADPIAFLSQAVNITSTNGGVEREGDENYRERIYRAPERFSCAGPTGSYEYFTKTASALINDVTVTNPSGGVVRVFPLLQDGKLPDTEIINLVKQKLNITTIRPLTDKVEVEMPEQVKAEVKVSYWIDRADAVYAKTIQEKVEKAVNEYIAWQKEKLGRDVNPTELYYRLRTAGAKRADLGEFSAQTIKENQVAIVEAKEIKFEGLEDA